MGAGPTMELTMGESVTGAAAVPAGWRGLALRGVLAGLRASLKVSPRPMAWVIRRQFARSGADMVSSLRAGAPPDAEVGAVIDERYGDCRDARLDVYTPVSAAAEGRCLPTVVWTHGGGFVGGSKDELRDYLRRIAAASFTVVAVEYSLAPGVRHPTQVRQVMAAMAHVQANADRLHVDPDWLVMAGDSAGSHITTQAAALATNPGYADQLGVAPTITPGQLRGVALCCGVYDLTLVDPGSPLRDFILTVGWSYSGTRDYRTDERFIAMTTLTRHITDAFPPTFVTVGNADPLRSQSDVLVAALTARGVDAETLTFPADHEPPLGHEYQFDLGLDEGRIALTHLIAFFRRVTDAAGADR